MLADRTSVRFTKSYARIIKDRAASSSAEIVDQFAKLGYRVDDFGLSCFPKASCSPGITTSWHSCSIQGTRGDGRISTATRLDEKWLRRRTRIGALRVYSARASYFLPPYQAQFPRNKG